MPLQTTEHYLKINWPLLAEQADFLLALSENQLAFYPEACEVISGVLGLIDALEAEAVGDPLKRADLSADSRSETLDILLDINGTAFHPMVQYTSDGRPFVDSEIHWAAFHTADVKMTSHGEHVGFTVARDITRGATPSSIILWPIVERPDNAPKIDEED